MGLIVLNVIAVMLETVDSLYASYATEFLWFEAISVAIFSIEYLGRLWAATEHPDYQHPIWGRLRYAISPYMIIDLLAILPFFFGAILDLRFLRALRLLRFLRLFKLARYSESIQLFVRVLQLKREELVITSVVGSLAVYDGEDVKPAGNPICCTLSGQKVNTGRTAVHTIRSAPLPFFSHALGSGV